jgi:lysophospholipase-2
MIAGSMMQLIFLHGLGDSGHGWASQIAEIVPSYVKVICPTAPVQPVTLNGGYAMTSWFDLLTLSPDGKEDQKGILTASGIVAQMLADEETKSGIPSKRIAIGGFSQGGGLAVHTGLRYPKPLAGVLALSCWLPLHKEYPAAASEANKQIAMLQCHGDQDQIVPYPWGCRSSEMIKAFNPSHQFKSYPGMAHSSCKQVNPLSLRTANYD